MSEPITSLSKIIILVLLISAPSFSSFAQNQIIGKWLSEDKEGIIEIYKQGEKFSGKITWLNKPNDSNGKPLTDSENPDKSKRSQPLLGLTILKDFVYINKEWKNGTIYDPEIGKTYSCTMWLIDDQHLKIRGYWGVFYRTERWSRVTQNLRD